MITPATLVPTLLPIVPFAKYSLAVTGAVLIFGVSSHGALNLVSANAHRMTQPVALSGDFNLPPVQQIAELTPIVVEPGTPLNDGAGSMVTSPGQRVQVALAPEADVSPGDLTSPAPMSGLRPGRIGPDAVNVRAGASKSAHKLGVLEAGAPVMIGRNEGGWVEVQFEGGSGWVYSSYLVQGGEVEVTVDYGATSRASITVRGGSEDRAASGRLVEAGSSMVARDEPRSGAERSFRIRKGERLRIIDRDGEWARVTTASGDTGWVRLG
jgi:SH3-like domain-containing protein